MFFWMCFNTVVEKGLTRDVRWGGEVRLGTTIGLKNRNSKVYHCLSVPSRGLRLRAEKHSGLMSVH